MTSKNKPRVGISACLSGEAVRYDGGHKYQPLISQVLQPWLDFVALCPEVSAELGVPRPPVQLVRDTEQTVNAVGVNNKHWDVTQALQQASTGLLSTFAPPSACGNNLLCGFILKSRSPSCGLGSTPIYNPQGDLERVGNGIFAETLRQQHPHAVCVDEEWLNSPERCQQFLRACYLVMFFYTNKQNYEESVALYLRGSENLSLAQQVEQLLQRI